jgi:hypothetical protein
MKVTQRELIAQAQQRNRQRRRAARANPTARSLHQSEKRKLTTPKQSKPSRHVYALARSAKNY